MMKVKQDFPILEQMIHGKPLVYLDSAVTTQKPRAVIEAMQRYYNEENANVHRGVYTLSERATLAYENARKTIQRFIHAQHAHEIIFTSGATEAINLVAYCMGRNQIKKGDEIVISEMEHHSNIVPWQVVCEQTGAELKVISVQDDGCLDLGQYQRLINKRTKIVAITHISNVLGTINPVKEMIALAHAQNIPVLLDGAQAVAHVEVNVQELDCDFYVFSSHKMYGPTGVGILYGKTSYLEQLPPYQTGGNMIRRVSFSKTEYNALPYKFEAGTPPVAEVIGLAAAIEYLSQIGMANIVAHEKELNDYMRCMFDAEKEINVLGTVAEKIALASFVMKDAHPHDIATILDHDGVAIRAGHHCAMPLMARFNVPATARVSLGLYNQKQDLDCLMMGLHKVKKILA